MVDWVTQLEASRRLGVSKQLINKHVKDGLFPMNRFKQIDFDQVQRDYTPSKDRKKVADSEPAPNINRKNSPTDPDYWAARTRRETSEANISEIKQQELKDSLVAKEAVRRTVYEIFRGLRDAFAVVPRRIAGEVSTVSDPEECIEIVDREIKHVLKAVSDEIRKADLE